MPRLCIGSRPTHRLVDTITQESQSSSCQTEREVEARLRMRRVIPRRGLSNESRRDRLRGLSPFDTLHDGPGMPGWLLPQARSPCHGRSSCSSHTQRAASCIL